MLDQILCLSKEFLFTVQTFVDYPHTYGNIPNIVFCANRSLDTVINNRYINGCFCNWGGHGDVFNINEFDLWNNKMIID